MSKLIEDYFVDKEGYLPDHIQEEGGGWKVFFDSSYEQHLFQDRCISVQEVMEWIYEKKVLGDAYEVQPIGEPL